jgi:hypothetical protein
MNWHYIAHIIRDVFPFQAPVIYYGKDFSILNHFRSQEHGLETFCLTSEIEQIDSKLNNVYYWNSGINFPFFCKHFCNLFISINYNIDKNEEEQAKIVEQLKFMVKKNGKILVCNSGSWANLLDLSLKQDLDLQKEIRRFSIFKNENVKIYENF